MTIVTFLTAVFCLFVGAVVLWANPRRFPNQAFAVTSLLTSLRYWAVYEAIKAGIQFGYDHSTSPVPWLRLGAAIGSFVPWSISLLQEALVADVGERLRAVRRSAGWFALGALFATIAFTDLFIPSDSRPDAQKHGIFYNAHIACGLTAYLWLVARGWRMLGELSGIRRVEMQLVAMNVGIAASLSTVNALVRTYYFHDALAAISPLIIFGAFVLTAWGIAVHRIFDAQHVFLVIGQRVALITLLSLGIFSVRRLDENFLPPPADLIVAVAVCCSGGFWLDRKTRAWLGLDGERALREFRSAAIAAALTEPRTNFLVAKFEKLLCERTETKFAALLFQHGSTHVAGQLELTSDRLGHRELCQTGWATPESLQRRRPNTGTSDLREFLAQNSLGVIIATPRGSPAPSLLLVLGTKTNRSPFTYPEVQRLQNIAELMDNILTRARLTTQAALEAKMQHLATMSRGLAHDLKNLITPISSFLVHTDGRFAAGSAEAEVHGDAKRSVRLMTDYVREALFFSSRLTPHFEEIEVERAFAAVREVSAARAAERGVTIALQPGGARVLTADGVLLQRMLANLVNNAIDASTPGKVVTLRCIESEPGRVRFEVADDGCGIPTENLTHIFEPYFTTKQFGDEVRGFGLGLTICEKIVNLHQGTILVRSEAGRGTSVTVDLPAAPSAFALPAQDSVAT